VALWAVLALALLAAPPVAAQNAAEEEATADDAYRDLLTLPQIPEDAVERRVQDDLDAAGERIAETLARLDLVAAPGVGPGSADAPGLDLAEAVVTALANNPALRAAEEQRAEVAAGVTEVKADAFPQLAAVSSYSLSRNPSFLNSPDFEDILQQFPGGDFTPGEQELYSVGVSVSQPVYTFGKLGAAIELARMVVDVTEARIAAARMDTALAAALAYYEVLASREALAVVLVQHRVRSQALEVVRARYEIGEATRLELLRAQSAVAEVTPRVAEAAGGLEVARSELGNVLGLPRDAEVQVSGASPYALSVADTLDERLDDTLEQEAVEGDTASAEPTPPPPPPAEALPQAPELAALWSAARANRPEIADLELQRDVLAKRQVVTRAEGRPQIEFNGFLGREARFYDNLADPLYDNYAFSLNLSWEFFDGGRRRGQIEQLESQRRQLGHRLADLLDSIELDLARSRASYRSALERYRAARTAVIAAREASRVARASYREGVALQTDWLDAQRQETEAEIAAVGAYYDARRQAARLARAVGAYPTEGAIGAEPGLEPGLEPSSELSLEPSAGAPQGAMAAPPETGGGEETMSP